MRDKLRIVVVGLIGVAFLVVSFVALLSLPSVSDLLEIRAQSQNYDAGETGRFGRQSYAFALTLESPLGIGPLQFRDLRVAEDPHNVYVTVLHHYGWGGAAAYYSLVVLTLWRGLQGLAHVSPYRLMMIPLFATFSCLVLESFIIDTDHWRHWFLIAGLIWGVAAAIEMDPRRTAPRKQMLV